MRRCLVVGTINRYVAPEGWKYVHVDASDRGIWDPETKRLVPIDVQADMRDLPFEDASVDRIQCWHALEHVNEQGGWDAVAEFARVLRPGGTLDLVVPDLGGLRFENVEESLSYIYGQQFEMKDAELNLHRWGYVEASLRRLLSVSGFGTIRRKRDGDLHLIARRLDA